MERGESIAAVTLSVVGLLAKTMATTVVFAWQQHARSESIA